MGTLCFALPVFFKQRSMQMFPAWAFATPAAIMRLPFSVIDATLFTAIMYFPTGLAPAASRFFIFWGFHILFSQVQQKCGIQISLYHSTMSQFLCFLCVDMSPPPKKHLLSPLLFLQAGVGMI